MTNLQNAEFQQLDLFSFLQEREEEERLNKVPRLKAGDYIGRVVLGEVYKAKITKVEGNERYFFYRTDAGICFNATDRTDFEQMEKEALENRKRYQIIEIDKFDQFFAVKYPARAVDGKEMFAMVGIYKGMLFWKHECTYQFLEPVKNLEKEYKKHVQEMTKDKIYEKLEYPIPTIRLYLSKKGFYTDARYVFHNG